MKFNDLLTLAATNLIRRRLRTLLTIIGVLIGTTSIVTLVSISYGIQRSFYEEIGQDNQLTTITVSPNYNVPGASTTGPPTSDELKKMLTDDRVSEFKAIDGVIGVYPHYQISINGKYNKFDFMSSLLLISHEEYEQAGIYNLSNEQKLDPSTQVPQVLLPTQLSSAFYQTQSAKSARSVRWSDLEVDTSGIEAKFPDLVLSVTSYNSNYGLSTSEGAETKPPKRFLIQAIGRAGNESNYKQVLAQKNQTKPSSEETTSPQFAYSEYSFNAVGLLDQWKPFLERLYRPYALSDQRVTKNGRQVGPFVYSNIAIRCKDIDTTKRIFDELNQQGFVVSSMISIIESNKQFQNTLMFALGGIGAISLLVAAIGIANTMMMSIYERTKEIGIFKVLGLSLHKIRNLFLMEAGLIGLIGSALGLGLSFIISHVIQRIGENQGSAMGPLRSYIPPGLAIAALVFGTLIGVLSGFAPARRAMKLSPLQAIRNE